jgi:hypothetical protein
LPGDSDVDVDAEHSGEQSGGEFSGELEQCGRAGLAGLDAEVFEAFSQMGGSDRAAGLTAGNSQDEGVAAPVVACPRLPSKTWRGEVGDGLGHGDGCGAELDRHRGVVDRDVVGGEPGDPGDGLGVEQDEQTGEAVSGADGVVVKETPGGVSAGLLVDGAGGALPAGGREGQRGEALPVGPPDEVASVVVVGGGVVCQPLLEVGLAAGRQGQAAGGEPVEQGDGGADALEYDGVLLVGGGVAVVAATQPTQQVPGGTSERKPAVSLSRCYARIEPGRARCAGRSVQDPPVSSVWFGRGFGWGLPALLGSGRDVGDGSGSGGAQPRLAANPCRTRDRG